MKRFTVKKVWQKFVIAIMTVILIFQFMLPVKSEAIFDVELPSAEEVLVGIAQVAAGAGDLVMGALNNFMLGTKGFGSAMISSEALGNESWFNKDKDGNAVPDKKTSDTIDGVNVETDADGVVVYVEPGSISEGALLAGSDNWEVPNLLYCPENIFANNIAMLDVNFLNPNTYNPVVVSPGDRTGSDVTSEERSHSVAGDLKLTIKSWYLAFRDIAVVALLSILVYLGIRILISSTSEDKAKYKEIIKDWLVALVLIFVMHFIMSATMVIVNSINHLFVDLNNNVYVNYGDATFRSNFMGVIRFLAQSKDGWNAWAYTIIYWTLVIYTIRFTIQYLSRVLYIAFYTMISPLVAITYPLDKLGDGKSQAFNKWLKEYIMTMTLQPIHLIIYSMLVSSALTLSIQSPIYALVAIGFLIPAEQFIRGLFGVDSKADKGFGSFAKGALAMQAVNSVAGMLKKPLPIGDKKDKEEEDSEVSRIRPARDNRGLNTFASESTADDNADYDDDENTPIRRPGNNNDNDGHLPLEPGQTDDGDMDDDELAMQRYRNAFGNSAEAFWNPYTGQYDENYNPEDDEMFQQFYADDTRTATERHRDAYGDKATAFWNPHQDENGVGIGYDENYDPTQDPDWNQGFNNNQPQVDDNDQIDLSRNDDEQHGVQVSVTGGDEEAARLRRMNRQIRRSYAKRALSASAKGLYKGAKFTAKHGARLGLKAAGAFAVGATTGLIGAAYGLASGQGLSGVIKGAAAGAAGGAAVGNAIGTNAYNLGRGALHLAENAENKVFHSGAHSLRSWARNEYIRNTELRYGKERADQEARRLFRPNEEQREQFNDIAMKYNAETGQNLSWKDLKERIYDYHSNGITDTDKIVKGLKLEHKYDGQRDIHDKMVDVMALADKYDINEEKSLKAYNEKMRNKGITGKAKENVDRLFCDVNSIDYDTWKANHSGSRNNRSTQQTGNSGGTRRGGNAGGGN